MAATLGTVVPLADKTDQARFLLRAPITLDDSYPATNGYPLLELLNAIDVLPRATSANTIPRPRGCASTCTTPAPRSETAGICLRWSTPP
jgi:hypothetical protein